jgi:lysylphosphatidylglycerol synthetase-like protein (DUF2156 family)
VKGDPGLARERTQLAWQRSAFSVAVIALLSLRAGLAGHERAAAFLIAGVLAGLAATLQLAGPRMRPPIAVAVALAASFAAAVGAVVLALL